MSHFSTLSTLSAILSIMLLVPTYCAGQDNKSDDYISVMPPLKKNERILAIHGLDINVFEVDYHPIPPSPQPKHDLRLVANVPLPPGTILKRLIFIGIDNDHDPDYDWQISLFSTDNNANYETLFSFSSSGASPKYRMWASPKKRITIRADRAYVIVISTISNRAKFDLFSVNQVRIIYESAP